MIPGWKIKRELGRLYQQVHAVIGLFWEPLVQFQYDLIRSKKLKIVAGNQILLNKVAIFLIYQPSGVAASTLRTIRYLEQKGYSTLVVSNGELQDDDLSSISAVAWKILVRPNYGYDFGGYRDGVLFLNECSIVPDRLIILNDSIWFPIYDNETMIDQIEASELDMGGTIVHRAFSKTLLRRRTTRVIESYLFLFNRAAFESTGFKKFWLKYRLSSNKYNAVHRGERKVAEVMLAAGLTADGIFGSEEFFKKISTQDASFIQKTLLYSAHTRETYIIENKALLSVYDGSELWRRQAIDFIGKVIATNSFQWSFVYAALILLEMPFLKKGNGEMQVRMRRQFLRAVSVGDLRRPCDDVLAEMAEQKEL